MRFSGKTGSCCHVFNGHREDGSTKLRHRMPRDVAHHVSVCFEMILMLLSAGEDERLARWVQAEEDEPWRVSAGCD